MSININNKQKNKKLKIINDKNLEALLQMTKNSRIQ